jgi:hypothetical protein
VRCPVLQRLASECAVKNTSKYTSVATSAVEGQNKEQAFNPVTSSNGAAANTLRNAYAATMWQEEARKLLEPEQGTGQQRQHLSVLL